MILTLGKKMAKLLWWRGLSKAVSMLNYKGPEPDQFIKNLVTDLTKIDSLTKVLGDNPLEPFGAEGSELSVKYYLGENNYSRAIRSFFIDPTPFSKTNKIKALPAVNGTVNHKPNEKWFFLNGIGTNEDMASVNAKMLNKIFKRPITPLHNPTNGFKNDLLEVAKGRLLNMRTSIAESAKAHIKDELIKMEKEITTANAGEKSTYKIVIIAHSQGGIIISNVVKLLIQDPECNSLLEHLEIYTFASAHDEYPSPWATHHKKNFPFTEHFANDSDYVAEVGVLNNVNKTRGKIYVKSGAGHLLNYHYLKDFNKGKYEGNDRGSRLYTLRDGNR
ncbi:hypothetical protein [uncultured Photobacterium sp.]|uniref:alpha/beta hydrolase n=1 Tax=uncultured Photobacterium sp. TaxID=173973 RepID=UPI00261E1500|nr:hypothetical protein [uncultured Photobacterium sp.]